MIRVGKGFMVNRFCDQLIQSAKSGQKVDILNGKWKVTSFQSKLITSNMKVTVFVLYSMEGGKPYTAELSIYETLHAPLLKGAMTDVQGE